MNNIEQAYQPNNPNAFSIEKAKQATEQNPYKLLEYNLKDGPQIEIVVTKFEPISSSNAVNEILRMAGIEVEDDDSDETIDEYRTTLFMKKLPEKDDPTQTESTTVGQFKCQVFAIGERVVSHSAANFTHPNFEKKNAFPDGRIKGILSEAIYQLLSKQVFHIWFSSFQTSNDAKNMYNSLLRREDISGGEVSNDPDFSDPDDDRPRFKLKYEPKK